MENLTENEKAIIFFLRECNPYEKVIVQKDAKGKIDNYIIQREQKIILTNILNFDKIK